MTPKCGRSTRCGSSKYIDRMGKGKMHAVSNESDRKTACGLPVTAGRHTVVVHTWEEGAAARVCQRCLQVLNARHPVAGEEELARHAADLESGDRRGGRGPYDLGRVGRSGAREISGGGFESNRRRH
jgi:hypothetical protein